MAAPGVFAPVDDHGELLVDGGLTENLPIDVARAMGADVLIVVDVTYPLQPRRQLDSALSISNQMLAILMRRDADRQKATLTSRDVLIEPALGGMSSTDFSVVERTVDLGEQAALALRSRLAALADSDAAYRLYSERRAAHAAAQPLIEFVRVDAESKPYERTILATMRGLVGRPLDTAQGGRARHGIVRTRTVRIDRLSIDHESPRAPGNRPGSKSAPAANPGAPITFASA